MKKLVFVITVALCFSQLANAAGKKKYEDMTPQEKQAWIAECKAHAEAKIEKKTGGKVRKPNSAKGMFVVLNAQKVVPESELASIVTTLDKSIQVVSAVKPTTESVTIANVKGAIKSAGGTLGVALVESDSLPAFLAAPEEGWVIVNVKPLVNGVEKDVAASRVRKEALRAFGFVAGGIYMGRGAILMREIRTPADLDDIRREMFCIDLKAHMSTSSEHFGITPWYQTTYLKACEQGWAPAPTNDNQKAIWDKVHEMPKTPIKILPETKKVTE